MRINLVKSRINWEKKLFFYYSRGPAGDEVEEVEGNIVEGADEAGDGCCHDTWMKPVMDVATTL